MFSSEVKRAYTFHITDPGADDKQIHLWRAPEACEIKSAYIVARDAQGAGSAGQFALHNYGTAGTAIKASGGTVAAAKGGTATADRLSAGTPEAYTISEGTMAAGEWLVLDYQETGDWVEALVTIVIEVVPGVAA